MYARAKDVDSLIFSLHQLFVTRRIFRIAAQQVDVFTDIELLTVGAHGLAQDEIRTLLHGLAVVGAVPFAIGVAPFVELLS